MSPAETIFPTLGAFTTSVPFRALPSLDQRSRFATARIFPSSGSTTRLKQIYLSEHVVASAWPSSLRTRIILLGLTSVSFRPANRCYWTGIEAVTVNTALRAISQHKFVHVPLGDVREHAHVFFALLTLTGIIEAFGIRARLRPECIHRVNFGRVRQRREIVAQDRRIGSGQGKSVMTLVRYDFSHLQYI
jgi:hypothetical protein